MLLLRGELFLLSDGCLTTLRDEHFEVRDV